MIKVTAEKGKFIVTCPFNMNSALRDITGKRWSAARKAYTVPFSRKMAEALSHISAPIEFDKSAIELMVQAAKPIPTKSSFPPWYRFRTDPMPHQRRALDFLWERKAAALFMAMRTGKTKTTIDWAAAMRMQDMIDAVVVFCPISVRGGWEAQVVEHCTIPLQVGRHDLTTASGKKAHKEFTASDHKFKMMIVGIESMAAGSAFDHVYDFVAAHNSVLCVVDESHMIKTHNATRSEKITNIGRMCEYRVILTGTPIAASPLDLFSQFNFLDPDIVGFSDFYSFKARYAVMGGYENRQVIGYENLDELMADIAPHTFQVNAEDVMELPPKTYMVREVQLTDKVRKLYNDIKKSKYIEHNGRTLIMANPLDRLTRLSGLVNGVMAYGESGEYEYEWVSNAKVNELMELIEENPTPTVIWTTGRMELARVVNALSAKRIRCTEIHGGVDEDDRIANVAAFQNGEVDYLVANTAVGGTGIKLSRAKMLVYLSNSFKYVDRKQSEERATDFINVGESVVVVDIVASDTVDDQVIQPALKLKQDIATFVNQNIGELQLDKGLNKGEK